MNLNIGDEYFGELLPFIKDETVTDITWNGRDLWLDDLERGRYKSSVKLSDKFVSTFSTRIANLANKNFNLSAPLLEAETDDLRISVIDGTVTNTNRSIAIRKTPAVRRLEELKMLESGYAEAMVLKLLAALVKGHSSIIVTGDVGSGKTELVKYLTKFIPTHERTISIEDNYELRLSAINPNLDCVEIKATQDGPFSYQMAIKAALRQLCKWLLMAEARSKEVIQLLEAASTGCIVMTTLHSDDVRKIPDRIVNMMGIDGEEKRNDVYNFFDVGVKVGITKTEKGIKRSIDQICVLDRDDNINTLTLIYNHGFTGQTLPKNLWKKVVQGAKDDISLFEFLKPDNADSSDIVETPEFAMMVSELEKSMREDLIKEMSEKEKLTARYGDSYVDDIDTLMLQGFFDENRLTQKEIDEISADNIEEEIDDLINLGIFDDDWILPEFPMEPEEPIEPIEPMEPEEFIEPEPEPEIVQDIEGFTVAQPIEAIPDEPAETDLIDIEMLEEFLQDQTPVEEPTLELPNFLVEEDYEWETMLDEIFDDLESAEQETQTEPLDTDDFLAELDMLPERLDAIAAEQEQQEASTDVLSEETEEQPIAKDMQALVQMADDLGIGNLKNMTREELIAELKKQLLINWINSLTETELIEELRREVALIEESNRTGIPVPDYEMAKIELMTQNQTTE